ncbi:MAG TPA: type II CAAX endopeptidase family protein [Kofleriaceae bacterium]|jgi:membrane protease YdiL (CAAX protease family)
MSDEPGSEAPAPEPLPEARVTGPTRLELAHYVARVLLGVWVPAALIYFLGPRAASLSTRIGIVAIDLLVVMYDADFRRWLVRTVFGQWAAIDAETERAPGEAGTFSWKILLVLVLVAVSLTLQEYIGDRGWFDRMFRGHAGSTQYYELESYAWWAGWRVLGYVVFPMILIAAMPGERLRDYHVSLRGFWKHLWIYVVLFLCVLPAVLYASTTPAFRHTYPFYRLANRSTFDLWGWECLYAAQFLSLEFFFRGFILKALRRRLGSNAIFVMIVPYCMIHYGKPLPETLGAIGAGLILGTLAMRTKSIWGGVLIHLGVAMTMDLLALRGCPPIGSGRFCGE